jgi:hypothetical protein
MRRFSLLLFILIAPVAFAWNATGHETVAAIAWDNMTPKAREHAIALLMQSQPKDCLHELMPTDHRPLAERQREFFIKAATWPDVIRPNVNRETKKVDDPRPCIQFHQPEWHFLDHYWTGISGGTGANAPKDDPDVPIKTPNAVTQLTAVEPVVECTSNCDAHAQAMDVAWIEHLVGDIHQPLHNAGRVTTEPKETSGDQGGNQFQLCCGNLHSFWDGIVDRSIPRRLAEKNELTYIDRASKQIEQDHPKNTVTDLKPGQFDAWSKEGLETAKKIGYPATLKRGENPSDLYRQTVFDAADLAIAKAGYRLAELFNTMFK